MADRLADRAKIRHKYVRWIDSVRGTKMGGIDLLNRPRDENDRRNITVQRTVGGSVIFQELADRIAAAAAER